MIKARSPHSGQHDGPGRKKSNHVAGHFRLTQTATRGHFDEALIAQGSPGPPNQLEIQSDS